MNRTRMAILMAAPLVALAMPTTVHARTRHHKRPRVSRTDPGHGNCLRFNKTTGAVAGAVAGGLIGRAVDNGGATGTLVGAGVGGLAGHTLARDGRKRC